MRKWKNKGERRAWGRLKQSTGKGEGGGEGELEVGEE